MAKKYAAIRTDLVSGVKQPADLVTIRYYDSETPAEVENGMIVKLGEYEPGERDVIKATAATTEDKIGDCAIVAGVELDYEGHKHRLDEYINEANMVIRAYIPRSRNLFSVTAEAFEDGVPSKNDTIGIGTKGKLKKSGTGVGTCVDVETRSGYVWYTIRIGDTEGAAAE